MNAILSQRICVLCGSDCSTTERFKDDEGRYYYRECVDVPAAPSTNHAPNVSQPPRAATEPRRRRRHSEKGPAPHVPERLTIEKRLGWAVVHFLFGLLLGLFGAYFGGSGPRRVRSTPREHVDPDTLWKVMIVTGLFLAIGGFIGGKLGWVKFHHLYSVRVTSSNPVHLACLVALIVLIAFVVIQVFRA